jgi:DNA sulfur modification protein DndD
MRLISIQFCNFRQFYGETPEVIIASGIQNTTIIHGNNGSGKTTLMNGFTWVLYEKFSAAFATEEKLVNKRAIAEAEFDKPIKCWVEVMFEHDRHRYQAKRMCRAYKTKGGIEQSKSELWLQVAGEDGRWSLPPENPNEIIARILPDSLHQYFFFDGERIEKIVRDEKKAEIAEVTKELLGVEVIVRSIRHLSEAKKTLENSLKDISSLEIRNLIKNKQNLEKTHGDLVSRQAEIDRELTLKTEARKMLSDRLLELSGAEELQHLKLELEAQAATLTEQLIQAQTQIKQRISTQGYTVFLEPATTAFNALVEGLRERGELPAGIKKTFVRELLDRQHCICGTSLPQGSAEFDRVCSWMDKAGAAEVEESAILMMSQVAEIEKKSTEFWHAIDRLSAQIDRDRSELSRKQTQLDDVKKKLRRYPDETIQTLQRQVDEAERSLGELHREIGANQQQIVNLHTEIQTLDQHLEKQKLNEQRQILTQKRIAATQDAIERLTTVKDLLEQKFRASLEKRVQEIFSQISFTPYLPKLNDKYELTLVENTSGTDVPVAASTGENQILSLSFISGIIDSVREWSQKNTLMGPDSSTFPVVMDSPFGSLDEIYRRQVAKSIPKLANQLVVLVTKTQWRGEVETEITPQIGREYVLSYQSPKPDCEEDAIDRYGVAYPLVCRSPNAFEYTEIIEVELPF